MGNCKNKSEYTYAWGGELKHGCHKHANAMRVIANAIGMKLEAEPDVAGMNAGRMCEHPDDLDKIQ